MKPIKKPFEQTYSRGLDGYIAGETSIGYSDSENGKLWYRGYDVEELAAKSSFEEVAYLLIHGELPTSTQYEQWNRELETWHEPPAPSMEVLKTLPANTRALMLYRTMLSVSACHIPEGENNRLDAQWRRPARILAWCSTLASAAICHVRGEVPNPFNPGLSFSTNFLVQSLGRHPTPEELKAFEVSMIVQAEQGFHTPTLAALTVISTGADLGSAVLAGMGAISGSLGGGACYSAFENIIKQKSTDIAERWVEDRLKENYHFPGFGHRIFNAPDPRVRVLEPFVKTLLQQKDMMGLWDIYCVIRDKVEKAKIGKNIYVNMNGISGLLYHALGLPSASFTIPLALSVQVGWMAHCLEYLSEGKMIEPGAIYIG